MWVWIRARTDAGRTSGRTDGKRGVKWGVKWDGNFAEAEQATSERRSAASWQRRRWR